MVTKINLLFFHPFIPYYWDKSNSYIAFPITYNFVIGHNNFGTILEIVLYL